MSLIGVTGGIGAGKSTVSRRLAEHGAIVLDADQVARDVVAPGTPGQAAVVEAFGPEVLRPDGTLDRAALAGIVFADGARLAILNGIVHPLVREETARRIRALPPEAVVVYDVPLLVEAEVDLPFDLIVLVLAPEEIRVRRLVELRGLTPADALARIRAQASDEARRGVADVELPTDGSLTETFERVDRLWRERISPAR